MVEGWEIPGQGRGQGQHCCSAGTHFYQMPFQTRLWVGKRLFFLVLKGTQYLRKS